MCGIVGVISDSAGVEGRGKKGYFIDGLLVDSLRGEDSTGIFTVTNKGAWEWFKTASAGWDFIYHKKVLAQLNSVYDKVAMIGHNRWATRGAVNSVNAHPFHHGKIIGVHNGSLTNHRNLLPDGEMFDVDSDAVFHSINTIGVHETVKKMNGAYAIVYHDTAENTLHLMRNDERPLYTAKVKHTNPKYNTMLIASEKGMVSWLAERNNLTIEEPVLLKSHTLLSINLSDLTDYTVEPLGKYTAPTTKNNFNRKDNVKAFDRSKGNYESNAGQKRRDKHSKKILKEVGLKVGQDVEIFVTGGSLYAGSKVGYIEGNLAEDPWSDVVVHNVPEEVVSYIDEAKVETLHGLVKSAVMRTNFPIIHLHSHGIRFDDEDKPKALPAPEKEGDNKKDITESDVQAAVKDALREVKDKQDEELKALEGVTQEKKPVLSLRDGKKNYSTIKGPRGYISLDVFQTVVQDGCDNCGANISPDDSFSILWTNNKKPICPSCSADLEDYGCVGDGC